MSDTNIVVLKGRLARAAELKMLTNGTPCISFALAVGESRKNQSTGTWDTIPHFFDVTTFSNYAKAAIASLIRGQEVLVTGRLQQNRWEKNGQNYSKVQILAHDIEILRSPKGKTQAPATQPQTAAQPQQMSQAQQSAQPQMQQSPQMQPPDDMPNFNDWQPMDQFPDEPSF